jgi:hypothetical protein
MAISKIMIILLISTVINLVELASINPENIGVTEGQDVQLAVNNTTPFPRMVLQAILVAPKICPPGQALTNKRQCKKKYE